MRHILSILAGTFVAAVLLAGAAGAAEYGALLADNAHVSLWWAPGAYKVMRTDPVPARRDEAVVIKAARNEYEPFLLVLTPKVRAHRVRVETTDLRRENGGAIPRSRISVSLVEYVAVTRPTDEFGAAGDWPDPLPPLDGPFDAGPGENRALWLTVFVPPSAQPGDYRGEVRLAAQDWSMAVPLELHVWDFALPDRPSLRSSFGMSAGLIKQYHNLDTEQEVKDVFDLYMRNFRDHRVAPVSPFELYPLEVRFSGIPWQGGLFVTDTVHAGRRALKVEDTSVSEAAEARSAQPIAVEAGVKYRLGWWAKTEAEGQEYTVLAEPTSAEGTALRGLDMLGVFKGSTAWTAAGLDVGPFPHDVASVVLRLFPTFRDETGTKTGTAWFDDVELKAAGGTANLVPGGDLEMDIAATDVETDFGKFDVAARRYIGEFGFAAFHLPVQGLGTGSFYSRQEGVFGGFAQGTPEYDRLLSRHLGQVEKHLAENGWLGKEYIYWFDEPDPKDYPFVREGMANIRRNAPRLTRFITEHRPGPDIMDVSEIGCTIFDRVDPAIIARLSKLGRQFWSYLCTGPKGPWVTLFIDHPAVNMRIWPWMSYKFGLKGILVWQSMYWTSSTVFPEGELQNPWADPMSYTVGYGVPFGKAEHWGNGDGRFLYPPNRQPGKDRTKFLGGPVNSVRWELLREGMEDYEYFKLLEKAVTEAGKSPAAAEALALLAFPESLIKSGREYTKDPLALFEHREKVARAIEAVSAAGRKK